MNNGTARNFEQALTQIPQTFRDSAIGLVVAEAVSYYNHEDLAQDFSVSVKETTLSFGTKNRLGWSPIIGFYVDPNHCTPLFLAYNQHKALFRGDL